MDTSTWGQVLLYEESYRSDVYSIAVGDGTIVAVGVTYGGIGAIWTSVDNGDTWTTSLFPGIETYRVRYGGGQFLVQTIVSGGDDYIGYVSSDGLEWSPILKTAGNVYFNGLTYFPTGWMSGRYSPVDNVTVTGDWVLRPGQTPTCFLNGEAVSAGQYAYYKLDLWTTPSPHLGVYWPADAARTTGGDLPSGWELRYTFDPFLYDRYSGALAYGGGAYALATSGGLLTAPAITGPWTEIAWETIDPSVAPSDTPGAYLGIHYENGLWLTSTLSREFAADAYYRSTISFAENLTGPWSKAELSDTNLSSVATEPDNNVFEIAYNPATDTWFAVGRDRSGYQPLGSIWSSRSAGAGDGGAGWGMIL